MKNVIDQATNLRAYLGIPCDTLPDAADLLTRLRIRGIIAGTDRLDPKHAPGSEAMWNPATKRISLSQDIETRLLDPTDGQARFTLYHEIAHAVLGHDTRHRKAEGKHQFGRRIETDERDADDFAIAFAIPPNLVDLSRIPAAANLAAKFGVPIDMVETYLPTLHKRGRLTRELPEDEDNYVEAMRLMRLNSLRSNGS